MAKILTPAAEKAGRSALGPDGLGGGDAAVLKGRHPRPAEPAGDGKTPAAKSAQGIYPLQTVHWPVRSVADGHEHLYYRAEPRPCWTMNPEGGIRSGKVAPGGELRLEFSTFFGAFSLTTWCGLAQVDTVLLEITARGSCNLQVYEDNGYEDRALLQQQRIRFGQEPVYVELSGLRSRRGMIYPTFQLQGGDELEFICMRYCTNSPPRNQVRLAIVMPTFKREAYVKRNVEHISREVLSEEPDRCKLFVIDNGRSLELEPLPGVQLIRNPNYGGSGGFARGLLEAGADQDRPFTHVMFCDDDVMIDPKTIHRILALLGRLENDAVVSGAMLKMGKKHVMHEKNANVVGMYFSSNHGNIDLTQDRAVARYDEATYSTFCGWWLVCYPLSRGYESFLPFPFFVGWDDVEMGLRCRRMQLPTVSLLGVAIWHDEFEKKDIGWRWYYHARNGLITAMLYGQGVGTLRQAIREIMTALLTYRYERAEYMIDGLRDAAGGSAVLNESGADALHDQLVKRQKAPMIDVAPHMVPGRYQRPVKVTWLRWLLSRITMNGHMLPLSFFKSADVPAHEGWAVEQLHSQSLVRIFRCRRVVYYEPTTGKGIVCTVDHRRYYRLVLRMLRHWLVLRVRWSGIGARWRADHAMLTSAAFWRSYLGRGGR